MSRIYIAGCGAVSSAGWGVDALRIALCKNQPLPTKPLERPGWTKPAHVRPVPAPTIKPSHFGHARFRRTSPISQYAVAAALEALGNDPSRSMRTHDRLGLILCVMAGCVSYSRRFYAETWRDPVTASPLVFPETVFNAPASHIASLLGTTGINYTLVGDSGMFAVGLALAAGWIQSGQVDDCLVIGAEELDWLTTDAFRMFARGTLVSEGAGAIYLRRDLPDANPVQLDAVTHPNLFLQTQSATQAACATRQQLPLADFLCDSRTGVRKTDAPEVRAWRDWSGPRVSPKMILGEGLAAAGAWQCIAAVDALQTSELQSAAVTITGPNQQSIGVRFSKPDCST